ncbi:MAG: GlsB/YeaQ/YmgE family stress response membrane protein [Anaerolinea sp.]|nr:GlsB/YeaQ/YmgE family stress response membrane protein [Anaerolinea sp.]
MAAAVLVILAIIGAVVLLPLVGSVLNVILLVLLWAFIGWLTGQIMRGQGYSLFTNVLLGIGGGLVGGILFGLLGLSSGGLLGTILSGVVGAVVLIYAVRFFTENKRFGA